MEKGSRRGGSGGIQNTSKQLAADASEVGGGVAEDKWK